MIEFLIKSTASMGMLLGAYYLFMQQEKMHTFKRFYLLFALVFSLAIPFISITRYYDVPDVAQPVQQITAVPIVYTPPVLQQPAPEATDHTLLIIAVLYGFVALILAFRFIFNINRFIKQVRTSPVIDFGPSRLVLINGNVLPYTFMHYIFIGKKDYEDEK